MTWRTHLPLYIVGTLGAMIAGLGLGFGLGQFTISGMDPFLSIAHGTAPYRETAKRDDEFAATPLDGTIGDRDTFFDPAAPTR